MTIHDLYGRLKGMLIMFSGIEDELMWNKFDESHGTTPMREERRIIEGIRKALENYDKALYKFMNQEADADAFQTKTLLDDIEGTRRYADDAIEVYGRLMKETISQSDKEEIKSLLERIIHRINNIIDVAIPMVEGSYIVRRKKKVGVDWKEEFLLYPIDTAFLDEMEKNKMEDAYRAKGLYNEINGSDGVSHDDSRLTVDRPDHLMEMATIGKSKNFQYIVHSCEYEHECPHVHVCKKNSNVTVVKINLNGSKPESIDSMDIESPKNPRQPGITNKEKKEILEWLSSKDDDNIYNWRNCQRGWEMVKNVVTPTE